MSGQSPRCRWHRTELLIAGRDDILKGMLLLCNLASLVIRLLGNDTKLFAENETELKKIVDKFERSCKRINFKMNLDRSEMMVWARRKTEIFDFETFSYVCQVKHDVR